MDDLHGTPKPKEIPPHRLEDQELPNGWRIGAKLKKRDGDTGGHFSVGYECANADGKAGFLKAIDLYTPIQSGGGSVIEKLKSFSEEVQCECQLLEECRRMDRIVTAIEYGELRELNGEMLHIPIPYIIFERAAENARAVALGGERPSHGWCLRTLHQLAVGLWQMHGSLIAHQDLKLSNVLMFEGDVGAKISDLGRAVQSGRSVPHAELDWPGDLGYAPPEFAYGYTPSEFNIRRLAADLYLLGSCASSIFTGASMNALLYSGLHPDIRPRWQGGAYTGTFKEALPHLQDAFEQVLERIRVAIPEDAPYREDVVTMIKEWCDPDPALRGHPRTRTTNAGGANVYSLERYHPKLANLAAKADIYERAQLGQ